MIIVAHRGGNRVFPENSIAAIHHSYRSGADFVEIDVRLSRDGIPVVIHDGNLKRLFSLDGKVSELTARELTALQHGHPSAPLETLDRVFDCCYPVPLLLHIKETEAILPIMDVMERSRRPLKVVWGLVSLEAVPWVKGRTPDASILAFTPSPESVPGFSAAGVRIVRLWDDWITQERINAIHGHGLLAAAMTGHPGGEVGETSAERLLELEALAMDWVLVNDVGLAVRTLKKSGAPAGRAG